MRLSTRLGPIELLDSETEKPVRLASLWQHRPAILIFLRHFG